MTKYVEKLTPATLGEFDDVPLVESVSSGFSVDCGTPGRNEKRT